MSTHLQTDARIIVLLLTCKIWAQINLQMSVKISEIY
jgi:hypothetical protein